DHEPGDAPRRDRPDPHRDGPDGPPALAVRAGDRGVPPPVHRHPPLALPGGGARLDRAAPAPAARAGLRGRGARHARRHRRADGAARPAGGRADAPARRGAPHLHRGMGGRAAALRRARPGRARRDQARRPPADGRHLRPGHAAVRVGAPDRRLVRAHLHQRLLGRGDVDLPGAEPGDLPRVADRALPAGAPRPRARRPRRPGHPAPGVDRRAAAGDVQPRAAHRDRAVPPQGPILAHLRDLHRRGGDRPVFRHAGVHHAPRALRARRGGDRRLQPGGARAVRRAARHRHPRARGERGDPAHHRRPRAPAAGAHDHRGAPRRHPRRAVGAPRGRPHPRRHHGRRAAHRHQPHLRGAGLPPHGARPRARAPRPGPGRRGARPGRPGPRPHRPRRARRARADRL
ncbi:MAG: hypothetical protein AVDCRST_MAG11-453, partial [uncultured Gemmatimonadaceae bacterium]